MALLPGTRLGPYEVVSAIGAGGMGEVYRAADTKLKRQVAIKILPASFATDHDRLARFQREAEVLASLNHPNIASIYGLEESGGVSALVMELVEGEDLSRRIARGAMPLEDALPIARQIAEALGAAHEQGIIHRDLKPANIKVRADGTVKVLDFGLAKGLEPAGGTAAAADSPTVTSPAMTQAGRILGTAAYMSPEQAKGRAVDKRADIWAFGVVLYEMLTGRRPFDGDDTVGVLGAVSRLEPNWDALSIDVPPPMRTLLQSCLMKDRRQRAGDMSVARFVLENVGSLAAGHARPAPRPEVPPLWRRVLPLAAALAVGAMLAGAGIWFLARPAQTSAAEAVVRFEVPIPSGVVALTHFALSPDGQHLAIAAPEEGQIRLRVRSFDALEARLLPGADGARHPFWKPDGSAVGFFADGKLKTIPLAGGPPATVTNVDPILLGAAWSPKGVIVFSQSRDLYTVNEKGGTPAPLYRGPGIPSEPAFLPDGHHFLFREEGLFVGALDGSPLVKIQTGDRANYSQGHLLFRKEGRLFARPFDANTLTLSGAEIAVTSETVARSDQRESFSVGGGVLAYQTPAVEQLVWKNRAGTVMQSVGRPQQWQYFRLSRDQSRIVWDFRPLGGIAVFDLQRGTVERFTTGEGFWPSSPVFSPDGTEIAFLSNAGGSFNPYVASALNQPRLLADVGTGGGYPVDWSPDGKHLLYWGDEDLWIVRVDGTEKPYTYARSTFDERDGAFSPDGKWIAYSSNESGRYEIYLKPFPEAGGRRHTVSSAGGFGVGWRHDDGRELFYIADDGRLTSVPVTIRGANVELGRAQGLFPVSTVGRRRTYELSPDGQRVLVATPAAPSGASITVLLNWRRVIEK